MGRGGLVTCGGKRSGFFSLSGWCGCYLGGEGVRLVMELFVVRFVENFGWEWVKDLSMTGFVYNVFYVWFTTIININ